jgi:hypothetical protein
MRVTKNLKNNHHMDKNYYRDLRIIGHIICTMVMVVLKMMDESTGSQLALNSPSSSHSHRSTELSMIVVFFAKSGVSCAVKL